jgi:hypothetical protein
LYTAWNAKFLSRVNAASTRSYLCLNQIFWEGDKEDEHRRQRK